VKFFLHTSCGSRRSVERRIRLAHFPQTKNFDRFDFAAQPSLNKALVPELMRREWIEKRQNCIALGPSGTGKTHTALGLGLAARQKGYRVAFTTAAALVHELMEARDERRLRALQKHLNTVKLLIAGELGYVPFTAASSELLFEVFKCKTKERPSPSFKSTQKHNHKPGLQSPFRSTRLVHYLTAIWHILSPPLTVHLTKVSFDRHGGVSRLSPC
jgi:DNA replication protein DnaC